MELVPGKSFNIQASSCIDALRNFETSTNLHVPKVVAVPGCRVWSAQTVSKSIGRCWCNVFKNSRNGSLWRIPTLSLYCVSFQSSSNALLPAVAFTDGTDAVLIKLCKMPQTRGFHYSKSPYREVENEVQTPQHTAKKCLTSFSDALNHREVRHQQPVQKSRKIPQPHSFFGALPHRDTGVGGYSNLYIKKRIETGVSPFPSIHLKI